MSRCGARPDASGTWPYLSGICPGFARGEVLRPARRAWTLRGRSAKCPAVGRMTLRPRSVPQSVRLKHPDGLEGASKWPLWGIRAHSATSPKHLCIWGPGVKPPEDKSSSAGGGPRHLIAPSSSEGMPLLTVEVADNRTFCPAVAKRCDYPQVAGAAKLFLALFSC